MSKFFSLIALAINLSTQSHAQSQNIFHIECNGIKKLNFVTNPSQNYSESEKIFFAINSDNGNFALTGAILIGPSLDKGQPTYKFSIDESSYTYRHRYSNETPDPLNSFKKTLMQIDTLIKLNRFTGQLEIIEQSLSSGGTNALTIVSGNYLCTRIKDKKF